ncbi:PTS sugar transporter subunit IIB [Eubacterium multiforme]|uniref:PTS system cellobiose-specific IIB component n=1 Tax=Eubacterium multiforme TaxID=83339 RepID=A0ABT9UXN5_9FIRM|nr:PTS sugar transporter subunit IIB [Eubacterium multiforme]MDQ0151085.1 PTS system cellobiose-specific IIB component [Eubacterium multiforme]
MRKIVLLCAAGMSTSMLVVKMQEAAKEIGYKVEIEANAISNVVNATRGADIVLLGPQVRFNLDNVKDKCKGIPVEAIDMVAYGMLDGKAVINHVKKVLED